MLSTVRDQSSHPAVIRQFGRPSQALARPPLRRLASLLPARQPFATGLSRPLPRLSGPPKWLNHRHKPADKPAEPSKPSSVPRPDPADPHPDPEPSPPSHPDPDEPTRSDSTASRAPSASASSPGPLPPAGASSSSDDNPPLPTKPARTTSLSKQSAPDFYPQLLALPITRRPLFPGFYKAVIIKHPAVIKAILEMMKKGQPYLGAFLLRDTEEETDLITDPASVHAVGVFAQITSIFPTHPSPRFPSQPSGTPTPPQDLDEVQDEYAEGLTAVLYPHRRIRINELLAPVFESDQPTKFSHQVLPLKPLRSPTTLPSDEIPLVNKVNTDHQISQPFTPNAQKSQEMSQPQPLSDKETDAGPVLQSAFLRNHPVSLVNVSNITLSASDPHSQLVRAIGAEIISVLKEIASHNVLFRDQVANFSVSQGAGNVFEEADKLADFAAAVSTSGPSTDSESGTNPLQEVLESTILEDRLQKALLVLKQELKNAELQSKIAREVESRITKRQREFYLLEQLKGIKKELGIEGDGKEKLLEKFREKANGLKMPEYARVVLEEELGKLQTLEPQASEFNVTRNYLDWLTQIPWGRHSEENFDLQHATTVLDEDHYGLQDVKDRILEFLAVGKLRGTVQGKILCLVGPPGVGKTSIGKSIARALDRQFFRFSVGGLTDVAEIKGHRRTYVGAMPGKLIQALKKVQTENPLVLIDEIDKLGKGHNGDPASALLEMLDPEQNQAFLDHYIDVPVDLSRILFVCTANVLDTIPAPLLDRMEVMEVSGYVTEEKLAIATRYLSPQAKAACGLGTADVGIEDETIATLIRSYCRESGVRKLKQNIEKLYRKAALKIVQDLGEKVLPEPVSTAGSEDERVTRYDGDTSSAGSTAQDLKTNDATKTSHEAPRKTTTKVRSPLTLPAELSLRITPSTLSDYLGPAIYQQDRLYTGLSPIGVCQGLGYTGNGSGSVLSIEVRLSPGTGPLLLTGKLGEVIRESAQLALSFVKANAFGLGLVEDQLTDLLEKRSVHLHMPEGSVGKEGPSAGIAILVAYISLFANVRVKSDLAMTGEMTLAGQVLPVGGLKEKILAGHRSGIKRILAPIGNRADIEFNVPESVKEGIEIVYVENVRDVLREAFKDEDCIISKLDYLGEYMGKPSSSLNFQNHAASLIDLNAYYKTPYIASP